jgi:hypothetical protein
MEDNMTEVVEEKKVLEMKIVDGNVEITLDTDKDGEPSVKLVVIGKELIAEALAKVKDLF